MKKTILVAVALANILIISGFVWFCIQPLLVSGGGLIAGVIALVIHTAAMLLVERFLIKDEWSYSNGNKFCVATVLPSVILGVIGFAVVLILDGAGYFIGFAGLGAGLLSFSLLLYSVGLLILSCLLQGLVKKTLKK